MIVRYKLAQQVSVELNPSNQYEIVPLNWRGPASQVSNYKRFFASQLGAYGRFFDPDNASHESLHFLLDQNKGYAAAQLIQGPPPSPINATLSNNSII